MLKFYRRFDEDEESSADNPQDEYEMVFPKIGNIDESIEHYIKAFRLFLYAVGFVPDTIDKYTLNPDDGNLDAMVAKYEKTIWDKDYHIAVLKKELDYRVNIDVDVCNGV